MPNDLDAIIEQWRTLLTGERFEVRDQLGTGGMGRVDRVHDPVMLRETALKRVPIHRLKGRHKRSVLQEAQISSQLQHPGVIPMHEIGVTPSGELFLDMKLIEGQTLKQWMFARRESLLNPTVIAEMLGILVKVCDTVAYAHSRGVLHLDIKPDNIMVSEFGAVYVVDWGLARLVEPDPGAEPVRVSLTEPMTSFGSASGTPRYMAPEQAEGRARTRQTDVFLLGGLLYYCLAGRSPYSAHQMPQLMQQVMSGDIDSIEMATNGRAPVGLARIASKALNFDPADRYESVVELQDALYGFLRGAGHLREVQFRRGDDIIVQGETEESAYMIVAGHCEVSTGSGDERRVIRQMGPGEVFGELALLTRRPRGANVRAITPVVARIITQQSLTDGLALDAWAGKMVRLLASRFSEVDEELRTLQRELKVPGVRFDKPPRRRERS